MGGFENLPYTQKPTHHPSKPHPKPCCVSSLTDRVTPFSLLLERIHRDVGTFSGAKGAKDAIRSAAPRTLEGWKCLRWLEGIFPPKKLVKTCFHSR